MRKYRNLQQNDDISKKKHQLKEDTVLKSVCVKYEHVSCI